MSAREPAGATISLRTWARGTADDERSGLMGYLSVQYGDLLLDGLVLRRSAEGRFLISFPARTDRSGRRHAYVRPCSDESRQHVERELLRQLAEHREEDA